MFFVLFGLSIFFHFSKAKTVFISYIDGITGECGSKEQPCKSFADALDVAETGDVLFVLDIPTNTVSQVTKSVFVSFENNVPDGNSIEISGEIEVTFVNLTFENWGSEQYAFLTTESYNGKIEFQHLNVSYSNQKTNDFRTSLSSKNLSVSDSQFSNIQSTIFILENVENIFVEHCSFDQVNTIFEIKSIESIRSIEIEANQLVDTSSFFNFSEGRASPLVKIENDNILVNSGPLFKLSPNSDLKFTSFEICDFSGQLIESSGSNVTFTNGVMRNVRNDYSPDTFRVIGMEEGNLLIENVDISNDYNEFFEYAFIETYKSSLEIKKTNFSSIPYPVDMMNRGSIISLIVEDSNFLNCTSGISMTLSDVDDIMEGDRGTIIITRCNFLNTQYESPIRVNNQGFELSKVPLQITHSVFKESNIFTSMLKTSESGGLTFQGFAMSLEFSDNLCTLTKTGGVGCVHWNSYLNYCGTKRHRLTFSRSISRKNQAKTGGFLHFKGDISRYIVEMDSTSCESNEVLFGSCIYIFAQGGELNTDTVDDSISLLNILPWRDNRAKAGVIFVTELVPFEYDESLFLNNTNTKYGGIFASTPSRMELYPSKSYLKIQNENEVSVYPGISFTLKLTSFDLFNHSITCDPTLGLMTIRYSTLPESEEYVVPGLSSSVIDDDTGIISFDHMTVTRIGESDDNDDDDEEESTERFGIFIFYFSASDLSILSSVMVYLDPVYDCPRMHSLNEPENSKCVECPSGRYKLGTGTYECKECPEGSICIGGEEPVADEGYWIYEREEDLESFYCPGAECGGEEGCEEESNRNSSLPICEACDDGYYKWKSQCLKVDEDVAGFVLNFLFMLVFYSIIMHALANVFDFKTPVSGSMIFFIQTLFVLRKNEFDIMFSQISEQSAVLGSLLFPFYIILEFLYSIYSFSWIDTFMYMDNPPFEITSEYSLFLENGSKILILTVVVVVLIIRLNIHIVFACCCFCFFKVGVKGIKKIEENHKKKKGVDENDLSEEVEKEEEKRSLLGDDEKERRKEETTTEEVIEEEEEDKNIEKVILFEEEEEEDKEEDKEEEEEEEEGGEAYLIYDFEEEEEEFKQKKDEESKTFSINITDEDLKNKTSSVDEGKKEASEGEEKEEKEEWYIGKHPADILIRFCFINRFVGLYNRLFSVNAFLRTTIFTFDIIFEVLCEGVSVFFTCQDFGPPFGSRVVEYTDWSCSTSSTWIIWLPFYILLLMLLFSVPFIMFCCLCLNRKNLRKHWFEKSFGEFYEEYKHEFFWFESVMIFRKFLVVFVIWLSFFTGSKNASFLYLGFVMFCFVVMELCVQPFKNRCANTMDQIAIIGLIIACVFREGTQGNDSDMSIILPYFMFLGIYVVMFSVVNWSYRCCGILKACQKGKRRNVMLYFFFESFDLLLNRNENDDDDDEEENEHLIQ